MYYLYLEQHTQSLSYLYTALDAWDSDCDWNACPPIEYRIPLHTMAQWSLYFSVLYNSIDCNFSCLLIITSKSSLTEICIWWTVLKSTVYNNFSVVHWHIEPSFDKQLNMIWKTSSLTQHALSIQASCSLKHKIKWTM